MSLSLFPSQDLIFWVNMDLPDPFGEIILVEATKRVVLLVYSEFVAVDAV